MKYIAYHRTSTDEHRNGKKSSRRLKKYYYEFKKAYALRN